MKWRKSVDMRNVPTACIGNESTHHITYAPVRFAHPPHDCVTP
jgi:hypothetical protein